jgi:hypothetical protein
MRSVGIAALYRKRRMSAPGVGFEHRVYPYLLKGLRIDAPNEVWETTVQGVRGDALRRWPKVGRRESACHRDSNYAEIRIDGSSRMRILTRSHLPRRPLLPVLG